MQRIVRWCLKNKSVVILATLLLIGSGAYAATQLNQELLPDISFPIITILTPVAGAGPDLVDEQVTQPVEDAIGGVQGIQSVRSTSSQGFSVVLVEFDLDQDTGEAESDLQSALDGISLPSQAGDPEVKSQSASQFPSCRSRWRPRRGTSPISPNTPKTTSFPPSKRSTACRAWI
jgi:hydrophobic/amphiphilic exporter-1 (mainly G- bacteria), HAE1 family